MALHLLAKRMAHINTVSKEISMKTTALFLISACILTACHSAVEQAPVDAVVKIAPQIKSGAMNKTTQTGSASRFLCKDDKIVRVTRMKPKSTAKASRVETVTLTFNGITEKLKSTVSETGKSYTSIHWRWIERSNNTATLTNTQGVILADICIEQ